MTEMNSCPLNVCYKQDLVCIYVLFYLILTTLYTKDLVKTLPIATPWIDSYSDGSELLTSIKLNIIIG